MIDTVSSPTVVDDCYRFRISKKRFVELSSKIFEDLRCNSVPGFHGYDWGDPQTNWAHHQSYTAPEYDLADVKTPVALYWSDNDYFAMPGVKLFHLLSVGLIMISFQDILDTIVGLPNIVSGMNHRVCVNCSFDPILIHFLSGGI